MIEMVLDDSGDHDDEIYVMGNNAMKNNDDDTDEWEPFLSVIETTKKSLSFNDGNFVIKVVGKMFI